MATALLPGFLKKLPIAEPVAEAVGDFEFSGFYSMIPFGQTTILNGELTAIAVINAGSGYD